MATLETNTATKHQSGKIVNKKSTRVDLTPMGDLGFLLITFFVFTTSMTEPTTLKLIVPTATNVIAPIPKSRVLTVIPYSNNIVKYYEGALPANGKLNETTNTANGIRKIILDKKQRVKIATGKNDMILIIKPTDESNYKNFVNILNEVSINEIRLYFIDKLSAAENEMLKNNYKIF